MLDPMLELYIFWMGIFGPIGMLAILFAWVIWWLKLTPKQVKRLRHALRNKIPHMDIEFDDGHCEILYATEIKPEGVIKSKVGKNPPLIFTLPRPISEVGNEHSDALNELLTRKTTMDGVPHFVGYSGKGVLTNKKTLATLEHSPIEPLTSNPSVKLEVDVAGNVANVFFPVSRKQLKAVFGKQWNQAQLRALEVAAEMDGMLQGKKYFGNIVKQWMPIMLILGLGIILVILAAILL